MLNRVYGWYLSANVIFWHLMAIPCIIIAQFWPDSPIVEFISYMAWKSIYGPTGSMVYLQRNKPRV
jgi:hypothetical protein